MTRRISLRPSRPRSSPANTVGALLCALVVGTWGCASSADVDGPTPPAGRELAALHDAARVEGLEDRRFGPEEYWDVVLPVLEPSTALTVEEVGRSAEGRPLREVRFGSGPTKVLLWSQMHGDESTASMALADLFAYLARSDDPRVRRLADALTLRFVPVLNPDGAARFQRRNAQGVDVNRDARRLVTPEGRTLKAARDRLEPDYAFNLHDQNVGTRVGDTDRGVAIALLAPAFDEERSVNALRERAMRVASVVALAIRPLVGEHVARYDDTFNPRAFGDLMATWGSSAVLVESGGWDDDPQKQHLRKVNFVGILAALEAIADGRIEAFSTRPYEELPRNGRRVGDLLLTGGTLAPPGLPRLRADLLVNYDRPLLREGGSLADVGDLEGYEARDTISVEGLFLIPLDDMLAQDGAVRIGAPARFAVARRPDGSGEVWRFDGGPPPAIR